MDLTLNAIVTIEKADREFVEEACTIADTKAFFYTVETNDLLLRVEFQNITPVMMFHVGRWVQAKKDHRSEIERITNQRITNRNR